MARSARLGFLVPPGNPTVEPEMIEMAPKSVSVHFSRMVAHGPTGTLDGQEERNRTQIEHIGESAELLAMGQTQRHHARPHGDQLYVRPTRGGPTGTTSARSMWDTCRDGFRQRT